MLSTLKSVSMYRYCEPCLSNQENLYIKRQCTVALCRLLKNRDYTYNCTLCQLIALTWLDIGVSFENELQHEGLANC